MFGLPARRACGQALDFRPVERLSPAGVRLLTIGLLTNQEQWERRRFQERRLGAVEQSIARAVALWVREGKRLGAAIALVAKQYGMSYADVEHIVEFAS